MIDLTRTGPSLLLVLLAGSSCAPPDPSLVDDTSDGTGPDDAGTTTGPGSATTEETGIADTASSDDTGPGQTGSSGETGPADTGSSGDSSTSGETGPGDSSTSGESSSDTGVEPSCGNGIVEAGEACDDAGESATCDADCTDVACGDSSINASAGEECEDTDLAGGTCEALGFVGGTLSCGGGCAYDSSGCGNLPAPALMLSFSSIKRFDFGWAAVAGADHYQLEERVAPGQPFVQVGGDIVDLSISLTMPLHLRHEASYRLRACNVEGCSSSAVVDVMSSLAEAVGYFKASNTGASDRFGTSVALSGDGNTLAVGANAEDSNATGIEGGQANNSASDSGAVYVFVRDGVGGWSQQAYVKASNTGANDRFGGSVALSWDGNTLAVGASAEQSAATGIGGDQTDDSADWAGAVYVFGRDGAGAWSQQAYVKASNTDAGDAFGSSVVLSEDGDTLAVGARGEASAATGIDGDEDDDSVPDSGAVYVFGRDGVGAWSQQAYVKASNPDQDDWFGDGVALSWDGDTLAVGAPYESSGAPGIDGDQADDSISQAGAVYVFARDEAGAWSQAAYVKASNPGVGDRFGAGVALSEDGSTLAVGALYESSNATGIDGDQANDAAFAAGAVYVFVRDGADAWSQAAYVKASNTGSLDAFGSRVALSGDGNTLAVAAMREDGDATGLDGDQGSDALADAGAAYVFVRDGASTWSQAAYVKAPNTDEVDWFGLVALSGDGNTLAVCASREESNATGVGGNQASNAANDSGAVYLY